MFIYYFNIAVVYFLIGIVVAILGNFVFKFNFLGRFWGALVIALIGACLGGLFEFLFSDVIEWLRNVNNSVNIFPPLLTSIVLLLVFAKVSGRGSSSDNF